MIGSEIQNLFSGGIFQARSFGQYFFQQASFGTAPCGQVLGFFVWLYFFVGIISGWFCPVAEIRFKVFSLGFGQHKF